ncbi:GNAT family N-acetyltransferase [Photobacterium swingsii]|uniref:GNAT family N-acetyltransferase n=1 Tax=Photobacterium swingsii TaxID=680026 RepID=UPI004067894D
MNVSFRKVSQFNTEEIIGLSVGEEQDHLISDNTRWLLQAASNCGSVDYGIYYDDQPAGLISLIDPRVVQPDDHFQPDCLYVWRFMIDNKHQGKGLSKRTLSFVKDYAKLVGLKGVSLTTMDQEKGNALPLYLKHGFEPTGRRLDDEIELKYLSR